MSSMKTGVAHLPLHAGKAPRWLFHRMTRLARGITATVIEEYGPLEMLRRLSDPYWFQAFGCVLGFDWHSSGLTTTVGGALKEGVHGLEKELGFFVGGGKGGASRKTPREIRDYCEKTNLPAEKFVYASRISAKVDSAALQDGYELYHHNFFLTAGGEWCIVQQGMNDETRYARRYHWLGEELWEFVCEPHKAICTEVKGKALNMVARESADSREVSTMLSRGHPEKFLKEFEGPVSLDLPARHGIDIDRDIRSGYLKKILLKTYEKQPPDFETLLSMEGVGPKTIRALSLVGEIIYGKRPSFRDPARFSYAHGGKDGIPYPVDRALYDRSIEILRRGLKKSAVDLTEKNKALKRLAAFYD